VLAFLGSRYSAGTVFGSPRCRALRRPVTDRSCLASARPAHRANGGGDNGGWLQRWFGGGIELNDRACVARRSRDSRQGSVPGLVVLTSSGRGICAGSERVPRSRQRRLAQ
jgi:hypothetical protein